MIKAVEVSKGLRLVVRYPRIVPELERLIKLCEETESPDKLTGGTPESEQAQIMSAAWALVKSIRNDS